MTKEQLEKNLQKLRVDFSPLHQQHEDKYRHNYRSFLNEAATLAAFGITICAGRRDPLIFIGSCAACRYLGRTFGGAVTINNRVWCWEGFIGTKEISVKIRQKFGLERNRIIQVLPQDRETTRDAICRTLSQYILDSPQKSSSGYLGNWYTAVNLKKLFGGRHFRSHGFNCWFGPLSFDELSKAVDALNPRKN